MIVARDDVPPARGRHASGVEAGLGDGIAEGLGDGVAAGDGVTAGDMVTVGLVELLAVPPGDAEPHATRSNVSAINAAALTHSAWA